MAPLRGTTVMKPSDSNWRNASRIGVRLIPNLSASSGSAMRVPGASWPLTMALRIVSTIRSRRVMWLSIRIFSFFNGLPLPRKMNSILCIQYAKKMSTPDIGPVIAREFPISGYIRGMSACAESSDTLVCVSPHHFFFLRKIRREACHALGRPLHRPLLHAERTGDAADAVGRRSRAGDLFLGGDPRRDHTGRGGNRCGDAGESGDPLPVVPCPLRGRVARG